MLMERTNANLAAMVLSGAVQHVVAYKAAQATNEALTEHTDLDPDGCAISGISGAVGVIAGYQVARVSDPAASYVVDKTFGKIRDWKQNRKNKKTDEQE